MLQVFGYCNWFGSGVQLGAVSEMRGEFIARWPDLQQSCCMGHLHCRPSKHLLTHISSNFHKITAIYSNYTQFHFSLLIKLSKLKKIFLTSELFAGPINFDHTKCSPIFHMYGSQLVFQTVFCFIHINVKCSYCWSKHDLAIKALLNFSFADNILRNALGYSCNDANSNGNKIWPAGVSMEEDMQCL
jgi:hypothetical protein